jgi:streptogramin lyase
MAKKAIGLGGAMIGRSGLLALALILITSAAAYAAGGKKPLNRPRGPALWVANIDGSYIAEFAGKALKKSGETDPNRILTSADLDAPWGLIFDSKKNLWVSNVDGNTVVEFTRTQLKALKSNNSPAAAIVIGGLDRPEGLAFDAQGNLWVANQHTAELLEFTASQLQSSGSPTPNVAITSADLQSPVGLAIDRAGNLWVGDDGESEVEMYTAQQLAAGGNQTPTVVLSDDGNGSLDSCEPLIFDNRGNLWVSNLDDPVQHFGSVVEFTAAQLAQTGSPTPAVTIGSTTVTGTSAPSLYDSAGIALDGHGNLWVGNGESDNDGSVAKFSKRLLRSSGSPQPSVFIDSNASASNLAAPFFLAFGPRVP